MNRWRRLFWFRWFLLTRWLNEYTPEQCAVCGRWMWRKDSQLAQMLVAYRWVRLCQECYDRAFPGE